VLRKQLDLRPRPKRIVERGRPTRMLSKQFKKLWGLEAKSIVKLSGAARIFKPFWLPMLE